MGKVKIEMKSRMKNKRSKARKKAQQITVMKSEVWGRQ